MFYLCPLLGIGWPKDAGKSYDIGEYAHWPVFHVTATFYIRKTCGADPAKYSEHCLKLVAFVFGAMAHYNQDGLWSGLFGWNNTAPWTNGQSVEWWDQGFFQRLNNIDTRGVPDTLNGDENVIEVTSDLYLAWRYPEHTEKAKAFGAARQPARACLAPPRRVTHAGSRQLPSRRASRPQHATSRRKISATCSTKCRKAARSAQRRRTGRR